MIKALLENLYSSLGAAIFTTLLGSFCWLYYKECGSICKMVANWKQAIKESSDFLRIVLLMFFGFNILFRTIFCREFWVNPLSDIIGNFAIFTSEGKLNEEAVGNILIFIPFSVIYAWNFDFKNKTTRYFLQSIRRTLFVVFVFSCTIELTQFFFKLGALQLSDIVFNTAGGILGCLIYGIFFVIKRGYSRK